MRQVLDRLETARLAACCPRASIARCLPTGWPQAQTTAAILGEEVAVAFRGRTTTAVAPHLCAATTTDPLQTLLKRTWEPTLSVTGAEGFLALQDAGTCCGPTPPSSSACACPPWWTPPRPDRRTQSPAQDNAPYQAKVTFEGGGATGWNAPATTPWFERALSEASRRTLARPAATSARGGTIPLMNMLSEASPPRG